jgi:hypothetical protein
VANTTVGSADVFVFVIDESLVSTGPAGNPWRPVLHTIDLNTAFATPTWSAVLSSGNATGPSDAIISAGQAIRGAAASSLTLVGPTGISATATAGAMSMTASSGAATMSASSLASLVGGTGVNVTATTSTLAIAASSGVATLSASSTVGITGGAGVTATATTGNASLVATAGTAAVTATAAAVSITAGTTAAIATASGTTLSNTATDTTPVLTMTSGGATGATTATHTGNRATPEAAVTANPGDTYHSDTGTIGAVFFKRSGVGNTGWELLGVGNPVGPVVGTTSNPIAPGAFAVVPEMTTAFTPIRSWCWVDFEITALLAPGASGATIGADFQITVNGTPVAASTRRISVTAPALALLVPGTDTNVVHIRRRLTGLTPGTSVTIAVEWMEVAGNNGTVTGRLVERSLTVSDT